MRYKNIFFDMDGTLADSADGVINSVIYALAKHGIQEADRDSLYRFIGPPLLDSFQRFYGFTPEETKQALADYREYYSVKGIFENELTEGCVEMLTRLKEHGCRLFVCTSKPDRYTYEILRYFKIDTFFDGVFAASWDEKLSLKSEILGIGLSTVDNKSESIMVGDRHHDIEGAIANGIDSIGILCGYGSKEELVEAGATYIVDDLLGVAEFIIK